MSKATVKNLMVQHPIFISPDTSLHDAAEKMKEANCGILPIGTAERLLGIITDRDIVIRAMTNGKNPLRENVRNYMTPEVISCHETDSLENAIEIMQTRKVNRLMVRDSEGRVSGLLSFGDILRHEAKGREIAKLIRHAIGRKAART